MKQRTTRRLQFFAVLAAGSFLIIYFYMFQLNELRKNTRPAHFQRRVGSFKDSRFQAEGEIKRENAYPINKVSYKNEQFNDRYSNKEPELMITTNKGIDKSPENDIMTVKPVTESHEVEIKKRLRNKSDGHNINLVGPTNQLPVQSDTKPLNKTRNVADEMEQHRLKHGNDIDLFKMKMRKGLVNKTVSEDDGENDGVFDTNENSNNTTNIDEAANQNKPSPQKNFKLATIAAPFVPKDVPGIALETTDSGSNSKAEKPAVDNADDAVDSSDRDKVLEFYRNFQRKEKKIFSQNAEDGVILALVSFLHITTPGFYVEFGTESGAECITRNLRQNYKWKGLLMDGSNENPKIGLHRENIFHKTILDLFKKYDVPIELDIFSEDTDYGDYWIVQKVLTVYKPKIVVHEVNQQRACVTVPKPEKLTYWVPQSAFHGGSVCAFRCLAIKFDYTMVYCESAGVNCFWLRNDLLEKYLGVSAKVVQQVLTHEHLFKLPKFKYNEQGKEWTVVKC